MWSRITSEPDTEVQPVLLHHQLRSDTDVGSHGRVEFESVLQVLGECEVEWLKVFCVRLWMACTGQQGSQN